MAQAAEVTLEQIRALLSVPLSTTPAGTQVVDTELPAAAALSDILENPTTPQIGAVGLAFNGLQNVRLRTPNVFKTATATATAAGDTAVWTPTAGKRYRLMGGVLIVTTFAASATPGHAYAFRDATTAIGLTFYASVPAVGATVGPPLLMVPFTLGNGFLSGAADRVLNINLSAALTSGLVGVSVWGTEE